MCSKLTVKTSRHCRHSGVFIVNTEHISQLFLVFLLLMLAGKEIMNLLIYLELSVLSAPLSPV